MRSCWPAGGSGSSRIRPASIRSFVRRRTCCTPTRVSGWSPCSDPNTASAAAPKPGKRSATARPRDRAAGLFALFRQRPGAVSRGAGGDRRAGLPYPGHRLPFLHVCLDDGARHESGGRRRQAVRRAGCAESGAGGRRGRRSARGGGEVVHRALSGAVRLRPDGRGAGALSE